MHELQITKNIVKDIGNILQTNYYIFIVCWKTEQSPCSEVETRGNAL